MTEARNRQPGMMPADSAEAIAIAQKEIFEKFGTSFLELKDGSAVATVRILPEKELAISASYFNIVCLKFLENRVDFIFDTADPGNHVMTE